MKNTLRVADAIAADIRLRAALPDEWEPPTTVEAVLERFRIPGISIAVVHNGAVDWAHAWGVTDMERGEPLSSETLFQAGSISKPVAAMCALRHAASGRLDLDADINESLVSWKVPPNRGWQPRLTVRQLLSHTAGLTVHGFPGYPRAQPAPTLVDVLNGKGNTSPVRVATIPGLQFSYSGGGYCVLQQLLVDVTGSSFPELARDLVLGPLQMTHSTYEQPLPEHLWPRAATGHRTGGGPVEGDWHVYPEMAAAGLWTTPSDLARFLIGVQQSHAGAANAIIPREPAQDLLTPQAPNVPMGLGLVIEAEEPSARFGHSGDDQGFVAKATAYAEAGFGAVAMSNSDSGWRLIDGVFGAIARAYGWPDFAPAGPQASETERNLGAYEGAYSLPNGRRLRVERDGERLRLIPPGQPPFELFPAGGDEWFARSARAGVTFVVADGDRAERLVLHQDARYVHDVEAELTSDD